MYSITPLHVQRYKKYRDQVIVKYNADKIKTWIIKKGSALNYYLYELLRNDTRLVMNHIIVHRVKRNKGVF